MAMAELNPAQSTPPLGDDRFRLLVQGVRDYAIFMLDTNGDIQTWNLGATLMTGYDEDEIVGKHFSVLYPAPMAERGLPEHELRTAAAEGRLEDEGWRLR